MNTDTKEVRWLGEEEKPKENEGLVISPDLSHFKPVELGLLRVKMGDGSIKEFRMNRAERRRFIKQNHLQRIKG